MSLYYSDEGKLNIAENLALYFCISLLDQIKHLKKKNK